MKIFRLIIIVILPLWLMADDSWMVYDDSQPAEIHIWVDAEDLEWMYQPENVFSDSLHLAQMHFSNAQIDEDVQDIGFRLRGNTSRESAKKSFKVSFNTFVDGRQWYGLDKLNLNGEHNDPSLIRAKSAWDFYNAIDANTSRAAHALVWVNDVFYGVYISVEHIDDEYLTKTFDDDTGNLWKCLWPADLNYLSDDPDAYKFESGGRRTYELKTNKDADDYSRLAEIIDYVNHGSINDFSIYFDPEMNLHKLLQYFASNVLLGSWDAYRFLRNNYYLYDEPGVGFHFLPYDYDNILGIDWFSQNWQNIDPYDYPVIDDDPRPLSQRLLQNARVRDLYSHFLEYYAEYALPAVYNTEYLQNLQNLITPGAEADSFRTLDYGFDSDGGLVDFSTSVFADSYSNQHVTTSMMEFINERQESLPEQIEYSNAGPMIYWRKQSPDFASADAPVDVDCAVFSNQNLLFVQVELATTSGTQYINLSANPIDGPKVELHDRWSGTIPAMNESYIYRFVTNDGVGFAYYPMEGVSVPMPTLASDSLYINEILASNDTVIADEFGEFDDYFELLNLSSEWISLDGYWFSDDATDPLNHQIIDPDAGIAAGSLLLLWADNDEEQGTYHCGFKLRASGEDLIITAPDGETRIAEMSFPAQETDWSFGRILDGIGQWESGLPPSPEQWNANPEFCGMGNLNCDEFLDIIDIIQLISLILETENDFPFVRELADMQSDGVVDILDIMQIVILILDA